MSLESAMSTTTFEPQPVPLRTDTDGVIRVGDSRVVLDVVIEEYHNGACADEIAHNYPSLEPADVYAVIAYYLRHRQQLDSYLHSRRTAANQLRREIEAKQPDRAEFKVKLLARQAEREQEHASPDK